MIEPKSAGNTRGGDERITVSETAGYPTLDALLAAVAAADWSNFARWSVCSASLSGQSPQAVAGRNNKGLAGVRASIHPAAAPLAAQSTVVQAPSLV